MAATSPMDWDEDLSAPLNARRRLPPLVGAFFSRVREFLAARHSPTEFHTMRLEAKHLRYTLELFRPCYPVAAMDLRLEALKQLQDSLGALNDAVASRKLLGRSLNRQPKLREFLDQRAEFHAAEFARHWEKTFDAPGQEAWWTAFLSQKATSPRKPKA